MLNLNNLVQAAIQQKKNNAAATKELERKKEEAQKAEKLQQELGDKITVNQFNKGDLVTIIGYSKGKGFTGHMKRHGFSGGRKSHGKNSVMRKAGSIGAGSDPSRVFPGMKMAGRSGNSNVTVKNLEILKVISEKNLLFVKGSVPGFSNGIVYISKV